MAAFEQIDALRKQNKYFLRKLKKQSEQLRQLTLSCPDKVDETHSSVYEAFIAESGPHRAPLTERNGVQPPRASLSTAAKTTKTPKTPGQSVKTELCCLIRGVYTHRVHGDLYTIDLIHLCMSCGLCNLYFVLLYNVSYSCVCITLCGSQRDVLFWCLH